MLSQILLQLFRLLLNVAVRLLFHVYGGRCWTQGKPQKLQYLRKADMWYLTDQCSPLEYLIADTRGREAMLRGTSAQPGPIYAMIQKWQGESAQKKWDTLSGMCCHIGDDVL